MKVIQDRSGRWSVVSDAGETLALFEHGIGGYERASRWLRKNDGKGTSRCAGTSRYSKVLDALTLAEATLNSLYDRYLHNSVDGEDAWEACQGEEALMRIRNAIRTSAT